MDPNPPKSYALSGKIMLSSIIILLAVVVIMVVLHIYARWYLLRIRRRYLRRRRQRANQIVFYVDPTTTPGNGLDASILNSLPTFAYSARTGGLECAICLSEFEDNEMGRKLPGCHHSFHIDCIDMWFHSHSTCPICRSTVEVESEPQDKNKIISKPETDPVPILVREPGSSSGLSERRKGLDLSGVRIEVPRRSELDDESHSASHEFRSPLYSLRRILSMKRRTTPSSPLGGSGSGAGSSSRGYVGADPDIESGRSESTRSQTLRWKK